MQRVGDRVRLLAHPRPHTTRPHPPPPCSTHLDLQVAQGGELQRAALGPQQQCAAVVAPLQPQDAGQPAVHQYLLGVREGG